MKLPTEEELAKQEAEYRAKIAAMTSHEFARELLELPEGRMVFITAADGPYTQTVGLASLPWYVDWEKSIRLHLADTSVAVAGGG